VETQIKIWQQKKDSMNFDVTTTKAFFAGQRIEKYYLCKYIDIYLVMTEHKTH